MSTAHDFGSTLLMSTLEPLGPGGGGGIGTLDPSTAPDHGDTDTLTRPEESFEEGDHERFAHFVRKGQDMQSMVTGAPVTALCGKKWVPSRDPKKFPVCPTCKKIWESMPKGEGE